MMRMNRAATAWAAILTSTAACLGLAYGCSSAPSSACGDNASCQPGADATADVRGDGLVGSEGSSIQDGGPNEAGEGGTACPGALSLACDGGCVDPTLPAHCGTCDNACPGPDSGAGAATCSYNGTSGMCGLGCDPDGSTPLDCNGACVDPTLPATCGGCTNACPGPDAGTGQATCGPEAGVCGVECSGGTSQRCGASCFAPNDVNHCGSCTNACAGPPSGNGQATCAGVTPTCAVSCTTGYHMCNADCLTNTDAPSDTADPCILTEVFGVFVAPTGSDTTGTGTRSAPYATVGNAMDQAKTKGLARVYACGTAGSYTENLVVGSSRTGITVYGGLNCTTSASTWSYVASDRATVAPASGYALQVTAAVTFEDFGFTSAAATTPGSSSIVVFASNATGVALERCDVTAGAGMTGQSVNQAAPAAAAPSGSPGSPPTLAPPQGGTGGAGGSNTSCSSTGGTGGSASAVSGSPNGGSGSPGPANGEPMAGPGSCDATASPPITVVTGSAGSQGPGATDWATFSSTGWSPLGGQAGTGGGAGQGGGGGGASAVAAALGGGGGGGAGGCGGGGGAPGTGGGSSIAVLLFDSSIALNTCALTTAAAGAGGNGAPGQDGQTGGPGGPPGTGSCGGGTGGNGGNGGGGGGGSGGISAGVVWTGIAPTVTGGTQTSGSAGAAGQNGDGTTTAKAGTAAAVVQFQ